MTADSVRSHGVLTIELVPRTCWFSNVRSNVSTADWDKCKRFVRRRSGNRCEVCGGRGPKWPVECHERWEYDDLRGVQRLAGLVALCPSCHEVKHIGLAAKKGRLAQALTHLVIVNGWSLETAEDYVEWAFYRFDARSQMEWALDVSWLERELGITVENDDRSRR